MRDENDIENKETEEERAISRLLSHIKERPKAPQSMKNAVKKAVHAEWQKSVQGPSASKPSASKPSVSKSQAKATPRFLDWFALKPLLYGTPVLVLIAVVLLLSPPQKSMPIATVENIAGKVWYLTSDDDVDPASEVWLSIESGQQLNAGTKVRTTAGAKIALKWNHASLRLDEQTYIAIRPDTIVLDTGQIYLDTGLQRPNATPPIAISTRYGEIQDIGTQFLVALNNDGVSAAVREGTVMIKNKDATAYVQANEKLTLSAGGNLAKEPIGINYAGWAWAGTIAPPFDIENASLKDFLNWVSRESGMPLKFADERVEQGCEFTVLHGDIRNLSLSDAMTTMLSTTRYRRDPDQPEVIFITER